MARVAARLGALVMLATAAAAAPARPNVLLLMADQLRPDAITPGGTPNLWRLINQAGLKLDALYSTTPTCTPARSALLTGLSPWYHGMLGYGSVAAAYPVEMPRTFSAAGYATAVFGKNHFWNPDINGSTPMTLPPSHGWQTQQLYDGLGNGLPNTSGTQEFDNYDSFFDVVCPGCDPLATGNGTMDWNSWLGAPYVYPEDWHPTAWVGRGAAAWLRSFSASGNASAGVPFFLKVSFHRPHSPYDPPARLLNATPASELPPVRVGGNWDSIYAGPPLCGPSDQDAWCGAMPAAEFEHSRRAYRASVKFVDEHVGTVLAALNATGLADNTYILFISDHADGQGDHNLWRKGYPFELSTHVPGAFVWPPGVAAKVPRGSSTPLLGELRDVFATVLDVTGVATPAGAVLNGTSWACLALRDPSGAGCGAGGGAWRTSLDIEHSTLFNYSIHWNGLVGEDDASGPATRWKYVFWALDGSESLFNLTEDPYEMTNLAADPAHAPVLARWRARLAAQYLAEGRGPAWVSPAGELQRRPQGTTYSPNFPGPE